MPRGRPAGDVFGGPDVVIKMEHEIISIDFSNLPLGKLYDLERHFSKLFAYDNTVSWDTASAAFMTWLLHARDEIDDKDITKLGDYTIVIRLLNRDVDVIAAISTVVRDSLLAAGIGSRLTTQHVRFPTL